MRFQVWKVIETDMHWDRINSGTLLHVGGGGGGCGRAWGLSQNP